MLGNISNNGIQTGTSVNQNESIVGVKNEAAKNIYEKTAVFDDSLEVSKEAKELLKKEQEVEQYKSLVLESPTLNSEEFNAIMELIREGEFIDNKDLAEAMQVDNNLLGYLFQGADLAS